MTKIGGANYTCFRSGGHNYGIHIMPLVIDSLRAETQTHRYTFHGQDQFIENRCAPACDWWAPGLKI